jgi:hypothetical protein
VVIPTISKTPEVKAMLWKAIQANEMLHSMDETTVMRMLMAMTHETHAAQEVVTYQGDPPKLFVVESGRVQGSYHKLGSKVDHPLAWFGKGQVMGEVTMIGASPLLRMWMSHFKLPSQPSPNVLACQRTAELCMHTCRYSNTGTAT